MDAAIRDQVAASRLRQGLPEHVEDVLVADQLAAEIVGGRVEGSGDDKAA